MNIDKSRVMELLQSWTKQAPGFTKGMEEVLQLCEESYPHKEWEFFHKIRFNETMEQMRVLFHPLWQEICSEKNIKALYFGITLVELEGGFLSQAIECYGSEEPLPQDENLLEEWIGKATFFPESNDIITESLNRLYLTAQYENGLGMDAEWPLGLAFVFLSVGDMLKEVTPSRREKGFDILIGFEQADFLRL